MIMQLEQFLEVCEVCGGAVDPPKVLALVKIVRRYAGIIGTMAQIISDGEIPDGALDSLADQMEEVRHVSFPGPESTT